MERMLDCLVPPRSRRLGEAEVQAVFESLNNVLRNLAHGEATRMRCFLAASVLLAVWRWYLQCDTASASRLLGVAALPRLHAECKNLLQLSLQGGELSLLVHLRLSLGPAPILTLQEELAIAQAVRLRTDDAPESDRGKTAIVYGKSKPECLLFVGCALVSGWRTLEETAISVLAQPLPHEQVPDPTLLQVLVRSNWLLRLTVTIFWPRVCHALSTMASRALLREAVMKLASAKLYRPSGNLILRRWRAHPALRSPTAAALASLAYKPPP